MNNLIDNFEQILLNRGIATLDTIRGCSNAEIADLESWFGYPLPVIYKDFLKMMGHGAGAYSIGTDRFYDHLFGLRNQLEELLSEQGSILTLSESSFVFSGHQGYIYHFFDVAEGLFDPPVHGYKEGDTEFIQISECFSDFLFKSL